MAVAALLALLALAVVWLQGGGSPRSEVVDASASREGWKSLEYDGVRVDVPADWERLDTDDCEFSSERWAPPGSPPCGFDEGVAFYDGSTFDAAHGPGVRRSIENEVAAWGGYVRVGALAVYASHADRDLVRDVLASARVAP